MTSNRAARRLLEIAAISITGLAWPAVNAGAEVNARNDRQDAPLHLAVTNGHGDLTKMLINLGAEVNARNDRQQTPLHFAAEHGRTDLAQLLIEKGAEINAKDKWRRTPLHWAITNKDHTDVVRLLIEKGADVNAQAEDGKTPLDWATDLGYTDFVKLLEDAAKHQGHAGRLETRRGKGKGEIGG